MIVNYGQFEQRILCGPVNSPTDFNISAGMFFTSNPFAIEKI